MGGDRPLDPFGSHLSLLDFLRQKNRVCRRKYHFDAELTINHMKNKNTIAQTGILCYTERG